MKTTIKVRYASSNVYRMTIREQGDWIDIAVPDDVAMQSGSYHPINLGFAIELPKGYEAHVLPRSSTFKHHGILMANSQAIIDETFCGNDDIWHFLAYPTRDVTIEAGTRIAQFRITLSQKATFFQRIKHIFSNGVRLEEVERLNGKNRGGIGSTGK